MANKNPVDLFEKQIRYSDDHWFYVRRNETPVKNFIYWKGNRQVCTTCRMFAWDTYKKILRPKNTRLYPTCDAPLCINPDHQRLFWPMTTVQGFMQRVRQAAVTKCWEWQGGRSENYGRILQEPATHVSLRLFKNIKVPKGHSTHVCHTCDNPPCVNPDHLYVGNPVSNARDMLERGRNRGARGSLNSHAILREEQVLEIYEFVHNGMFSAKALADMYNVGVKTIRKIKYGERWGHITNHR